MVNNIQKKKLKRCIKRSILNKLISRHQQEADVLKKLIFILYIRNGKTVDEAVELMEISLSA